MTRLRNSDQRSVREITSQLGTMVEDAPPILEQVVPEISALLHFDRGIAYGLAVDGDTVGPTFVHATAMEFATRKMLAHMYGTEPATTSFFNPARPDEWQRNRAIRLEEVARASKEGRCRMIEAGIPELGLGGHDQLRVLVCRGESLLAWVGGFRQEPFTWREQRLLTELVPSLRRRLWLERQLDVGRFALAALDEALSLLPTAAFVVDASARIAHANDSGRLRLSQDRAQVHERLRESLRVPSPGAPFAVTPLTVRGAPGYFLAVERAAPSTQALDPGRAARRWGLTPRQEQVLRLLVRGYANKSIAADLQCTVSTVEQHLTAILRKAGLGRRAELIVHASRQL